MADLTSMLQASAGAGGAESDDDFANTVLLLHGDGTNGAQNNTFLDSSTNNFTITRNGNTTQGSFSPFSKPDGRWGNYFNGSTDLLTTPTGETNLTLGTSDFTIEGFFYPTTQVQSNPALFSSSSDINLTATIMVQFNSSTNEIVLFVNNVNLTASSTNNDIVLNTWNHIAVCRTGGDTYTFYINGTLVDNVATNNTSLTTNGWRIGYWTVGANLYTGTISNFRIIKGTALYTGASLTVPTTALTAVTNTQLLTCQSNRFIDNSSNGYAITLSGTPKVTPYSPFPITTEYSPSVNGGSGYFDGTGDSLSVPTGSAGALGTGDFCVSCWYNIENAAAGGGQVIGNISGSTGTTEWGILDYNGTLRFQSWATLWVTGTAAARYTWNWVVVCREGTTLSMFFNGVRVGTTTTSNDFSATSNIQVAAGAGVTNFQGFVCNARVVKGSAVYDPTQTTITVPTAPLTAITNTSLLCNFTNAGIFDNTGFNNLETVGNAQIDTTTKQFGTGAMKFDGTGDWLLCPGSPNWAFGTGDFTIECWFYTTAVATRGHIVSNRSGTDSWELFTFSSKVYFGNGVTDFLVQSDTLSNSTWYHIAVTRSGTSLKLFVDGVQKASATNSTNFSNTTNILGVGVNSSSTNYPLNGFIDDLRITKGVARYLTTFTPPDKAFPNVGV